MGAYMLPYLTRHDFSRTAGRIGVWYSLSPLSMNDPTMSAFLTPFTRKARGRGGGGLDCPLIFDRRETPIAKRSPKNRQKIAKGSPRDRQRIAGC